MREKAREDKIRQLEEVLVATEVASETAWKAGKEAFLLFFLETIWVIGVNEDRLLARIESLEAALSIYAKNSTPDKVIYSWIETFMGRKIWKATL